MARVITEWPAGSPRVLMTDCWLQNAGDAAIAVASQRIIRSLAPGSAVVHAAYGIDAVGDRYPELDLCEPLDRLVGTQWSPAVGDGPEFVAQADVVISQGGGFLREGYQPWARIDALERAAALVSVLGLVGQTIGRFDLSFGRAALGSIFRRSRVIVVRDRTSWRNAVELGADSRRVHLGTDVSLALVDTDAPREHLPSPAGPDASAEPAEPAVQGIALTLSDHVVPGESLDRTAVASRLLAAVLRRYPEETVTVWSSSQGIPVDSEDDLVAQAAVERLSRLDQGRVRLVGGHLDAYDLYRLATGYSALLSMRFHPALIAAAAGIPSVLAMSDPKVEFFAGAPMMARVVTGHDEGSTRHAAELSDPAQPRLTGPTLLGPVLERLAVVRDAFASLVCDT